MKFWPFKRKKQSRGWQQITSVGGMNNDWPLNGLGDDADLWRNAYALTDRVRDLFKTNPFYIKYREMLWANVFGAQGIMLRMKIKETEDRVIYASDEKKALVAHENRINRLRQWASAREGNSPETYRAFRLADELGSRSLDSVLRGMAMVEVGAMDVYANQRVESWWREWQKAQFADLRGTRNYKTIRQLRLISAVRDGDFFIRLIKDPKVNAMGFTLQMINAEWCDRLLNIVLPNGNEIRMGIEYKSGPWGIGQPVAYHFITRTQRDWQYSTPGSGGFAYGVTHIPVPADQIVHYARAVDADSTRPAPWVASTIPTSRQLDQAMLAEVIAWRESACKTGFLYSDVNPEGGMAGMTVDPQTGLPNHALSPGEVHALPWGVKFQANNPLHPNANVGEFRKATLRGMASGMPACDYNSLAWDLESINFSAGRLGRLDTNEISMLLQEFDIEKAEVPIFEAGLEMALIIGAIPLPLSKFGKFNKPCFQGRRWAQVDETKAVTAAALRVANHFSSDQRECADMGVDFEDVLIEQAEANMLKEQLGISPIKTVQMNQPQQAAETDDDSEEEVAEDEAEEEDETEEDSEEKAPVRLNGNSHKKQRLTNGRQR